MRQVALKNRVIKWRVSAIKRPIHEGRLGITTLDDAGFGTPIGEVCTLLTLFEARPDDILQPSLRT